MPMMTNIQPEPSKPRIPGPSRRGKPLTFVVEPIVTGVFAVRLR